MKKIMHFSTALVALTMLVSCQKPQVIESPTTGITQFSATILQTKTTIDSDGKITWNEGDEITVTDAAEPANSAIYVAQSSGASTTFSLKAGQTAVTTAPYTATYGDINNQTYSDTGANCPLTSAETDNTNFIFSSPYAVLRIAVMSEREKTVGTVSVANGLDGLASLDCGSGVAISSTAKVFYVAVAPGTYESMSISIKANPDESDPLELTVKKTRSGELILAAGDLLPLTLKLTSSDWSAACVAAGTMITLQNGEQKAVEKLEIGDVIRTVDHETGMVSSAPVCFFLETKNVENAFTLTFGDGTEVTEVTVVQEHGFYDKEERKYAFINATNARDFFGHHFYDADNDRWLELKGCRLLNEGVDAYSVVTSGHLNHLSNGMLSVCDGEEKVLSSIFEYDDQMKFDAVKKAADIEKYGLTPLEKVLEYKGFTEDFYYDYNLMYLNVAVGKGLISWDFVQALSDYYEAYQ